MDQKGIPQGPRWSDVPDHRDTPTSVLNQKCIRKCVQHMYTRNTRESLIGNSSSLCMHIAHTIIPPPSHRIAHLHLTPFHPPTSPYIHIVQLHPTCPPHIFLPPHPTSPPTSPPHPIPPHLTIKTHRPTVPHMPPSYLPPTSFPPHPIPPSHLTLNTHRPLQYRPPSCSIEIPLTDTSIRQSVATETGAALSEYNKIRHFKHHNTHTHTQVYRSQVNV